MDVVVNLRPALRPQDNWALVETGALEFIRVGSILECHGVPERGGAGPNERIQVVHIGEVVHDEHRRFYLGFRRGVEETIALHHGASCRWRLLDDRSATSSGWTGEEGAG